MISCPHCGKDNKDGTSFCRACGKPTGALNQQPAMPTRVLDAGTMPVPTASETQHVFSPQQHSEVPPPPVFQSMPVAPVQQKRKSRVLPILLVSFLLILTVVVVGGIWFVRKAAEAVDNVKEEIKKDIPIPDSTPPTTDSVKAYLGDLYYPGSTPLPSFKQGENRLIRLQTSDSIEKVVAYYKSKAGHVNVMNEDSDSFTFNFQRDEKMKGLLTGKSENGTTEILLAIGLDVPALPSIPGYPRPSKGTRR